MEEETEKNAGKWAETVVKRLQLSRRFYRNRTPHHETLFHSANAHPHKQGRKVLGWLVLILGLFALGLAVEYFLYVLRWTGN